MRSPPLGKPERGRRGGRAATAQPGARPPQARLPGGSDSRRPSAAGAARRKRGRGDGGPPARAGTGLRARAGATPGQGPEARRGAGRPHRQASRSLPRPGTTGPGGSGRDLLDAAGCSASARRAPGRPNSSQSRPLPQPPSPPTPCLILQEPAGLIPSHSLCPTPAAALSSWLRGRSPQGPGEEGL